MGRVRYRCDYDTVDAAVRQVNDEFQDGGFPPVVVEGHSIIIPPYPEIVARLAQLLPHLADRVYLCL